MTNHFCTLIKVASTKSKNVPENNINLEQYRNYLQMLISKIFINFPDVDVAFKALQVNAFEKLLEFYLSIVVYGIQFLIYFKPIPFVIIT